MDEETVAEEEEQKAPVPSLVMLTTFCFQFFPMLKYTSTTNKLTIQMVCMRTNLTFRTISREPSLNTREICTARCMTLKNFLTTLWNRICLKLFLHEK